MPRSAPRTVPGSRPRTAARIADLDPLSRSPRRRCLLASPGFQTGKRERTDQLRDTRVRSTFQSLARAEDDLDALQAAVEEGRRQAEDADVALLFSRDQDLSEVEIREIARSQRPWIKIASAFPRGTGRGDRPGIDLTDWIPIDRATYEACLDPVDHRPRGRTHRPG